MELPNDPKRGPPTTPSGDRTPSPAARRSGKLPPGSADPELGVPDCALTRKLTAQTSLSAGELESLNGLLAEARTVPVNREIITEGYKYTALFVLLEGAAMRYRVLHDGRRQVMNIILPGDFAGFPACFFERALYSITALTDTAVAAIPFARLYRLFEEQPRLAAAMFWLFSCETAMYAERLIDIGRRSAIERVAHFLLELLTRFQIIGLADDRSFRMPLTQELIGDVLGLTSVHVSRTLRQLRADGLILVQDHQVTITDVDALSALADFERSYLRHLRMNEALLPKPPGGPR